MLLYSYKILEFRVELSDKKLELVKNAIENSQKFSFENYTFDDVQKKVIKKSSFILSSLSDDSLIIKYLNKVIEDVFNEFEIDKKNQDLEKSLIPNFSENTHLEVQNEPQIVEDVTIEESQQIVEEETLKDENSIDLDVVIDKVEEIKQTDFSDNSQNDAETHDIAQEVVISDDNSEDDFNFEDEEDTLIIPEIDMDEEVSQNPVFDLPKDEFPTSNPETLYDEVEDPIVHKEVKTVPQEVTDKILGILIEATKTPKTKDYIKIFYLKYIKKMKQVEIAKMLDMSETELSETYFDMVKYVKLKLY